MKKVAQPIARQGFPHVHPFRRIVSRPADFRHFPSATRRNSRSKSPSRMRGDADALGRRIDGPHNKTLPYPSPVSSSLPVDADQPTIRATSIAGISVPSDAESMLARACLEMTSICSANIDHSLIPG